MWRDEPFWLCFGATRVFAHYEYIPEYLARIDFLLIKYYSHENSMGSSVETEGSGGSMNQLSQTLLLKAQRTKTSTFWVLCCHPYTGLG